MIKLGTSTPSKFYLGSTQVNKIYLGSYLVYSNTFRLTIVVNGLPEAQEIAYNNEVWVGGYKDFPAGTVIENLTPNSTGYTFSPVVVVSTVMDQNRTLTFTATAVPTSDLISGNSRQPLPAAWVEGSNNEFTNSTVVNTPASLELTMPGNALFGFVYMTESAPLTLAVSDGTLSRGFFFAAGNIYRIHQDGDNQPLEPFVVGNFYGLKKESNVISIVKSTNGIDYTQIHTFGYMENMTQLAYECNTQTTIDAPQGYGLVSVNQTTLLPGFTYADLLANLRPDDGVATEENDVWYNSAPQIGSSKTLIAAGTFGINSEFAWKHAVDNQDINIGFIDGTDYFGNLQLRINYNGGNNLEVHSKDGVEEALPTQPQVGQFVKVKRTTGTGANDTFRVSIVNSSNVEVYGKDYVVLYPGTVNATRIGIFLPLNITYKLHYPQWKNLVGASSVIDLMPSASRLLLPNNGTTWSTSDGGKTQVSSSGTATYQAINYILNGDGYYGFVAGDDDISFEINLSETETGQSGAGKIGFYFDQGNINWQLFEGSWTVGEIEPIVQDTFYGVSRSGNNVIIIKSTNGVDLVPIYTFPLTYPTRKYLTYFTGAAVVINSMQQAGATSTN